MSQTINKEALAEELYLHDIFAELPKKQTKEFVEDFFEMISNHVIDGNTVSISGFGKFEPYTKKDGGVTPKFRPFTKFKDSVANK